MYVLSHERQVGRNTKKLNSSLPVVWLPVLLSRCPCHEEVTAAADSYIVARRAASNVGEAAFIV